MLVKSANFGNTLVCNLDNFVHNPAEKLYKLDSAVIFKKHIGSITQNHLSQITEFCKRGGKYFHYYI